MKGDLAAGLPRKAASYVFEHTTAWEVATSRGATALDEGPATDDLGEELIEDELRLFLPRAVVRAARKKQILGKAEAPAATEGDATEVNLALEWYFRERLLTAVPTDLEAHVRNVGMSSVEAFRRAVWREFVYLKQR
jgi:hypothetical protein